MSKLDLPFQATIPYHVQVDENISDAAKIFYGQIVGLSVKCGYIWATDEQLAEMKNTSVKNIERWLNLLEKSGFIKRETRNNHKRNEKGEWEWVKQRKIYVTPGFQKDKPIPVQKEENKEENTGDSNNSTDTLKNEGSNGPLKNEGSNGPLKNEGYNSTSSNYISKQQSEQPAKRRVVVLSELEQLDISDHLKSKIMRDYDTDEIITAVKRCLLWEGRPNDTAGIMTTLQRADTWEDKLTDEQREVEHLKFLAKFNHLDGMTVSGIKIVVGNKYIEFQSSPTQCVQIRVEEEQFKSTVNEYLEIYNITV